MTKTPVAFQRSDDTREWRKDENGMVLRLIHLLLLGAEIFSFEFWSDFIIRFQRPLSAGTNPADAGRIPPIVHLRLSSQWRLGTETKWRESVEQFPIKAPSGIAAESALQASTLVRLLGSTVSAVNVSEQGDLELSFSGGETLNLNGTGGWDEAWMIEVPPDDPECAQWSVVCDPDGVIYARNPDLQI